MGLCLVAVFAIGAMAAASAFAVNEPEYYTAKNTCSKKFGHLAYAGECTINGSPNKAQLISYTGVGLGASNLEGGLKIECPENTAKGKISGGKSASEPKANRTSKLKITYKGCHETGKLTTECTKTFSVPGTIPTEAIKATLVRASATEGGATVVANREEPESATKGFANFKCGTSTNFITVKVLGKIFVEFKPVIATPDSTKLTSSTEAIQAEKAVIAGCGKQKLLFENGLAPCQFLKVVENGAEQEPSWNVGVGERKYGTKKVEIVEKGEF